MDEMKPHVGLTAIQLEEIRAHGESGYPEEIVGVMLGQDDGKQRVVTELIALENTRDENRGRRYTVNPLALAKIERDADARGQLVLGFYHSHPDHPARPSATDLEWAWPFYSYIIVSILKGKSDVLTSWRLMENEKNFIEEEIRLR